MFRNNQCKSTGNGCRFEREINSERENSSTSPLFSAPPPATNVIRQGAKALPTLDDRKKPNGDNNRFSSKGGNAIDKERIINIDTLNPYMNK